MTPFFAYDRALISDRVRELRAALPAAVRLGYAVKANPMPAVVQHLAGLVDKLDVASAREMLTALDTGLPPAAISFAGPGKTPAEVRQAVAAGVTVELESSTEAARVREAADALGTTPRVAVRINPDFSVKGSGMRMGGGSQQFGVDSEKVPEFLAELQASGLEVLGFHVFAGSQNLLADVISEAQAKTVDLVLRLSEHLDTPVRYINLGGGFGIPYRTEDAALDLAAVGESLGRLVDEVLADRLPDAEPVIELGRYLVGESGVYVTRVIDRKESRARTYLVVDGGLHHQLAASGNFGQVIRRNYPMVLANRLDSDAVEVVNVVGCLCTPLDLLGDQVELPQAEIGDLVAIFQAGAYGATASPAGFLSHPAAPEMLVSSVERSA